MLAYDIKDILQIVPEAEELTKQASLSEAFPIDNRDSAFTSGLRIAFLTKVAGEQVSYVVQEKVANAVAAYGMTSELEKMATKIAAYGEQEKQAALYNPTETLWLQEEVLRGNLGFHQDLLKVASYAEEIVSRFDGSDFSYETKLYSSALPFGKDEFENAMQKRAYTTGDATYTEILGVVNDFGIEALNLGPQEKRASVVKAVTELDQKHFYNGDAFRESFVKQASYSINLGSKTVPWEKINKDHVGDVLGKEVSASLTGDYANDKAVLESLPLDEKNALGRFL